MTIGKAILDALQIPEHKVSSVTLVCGTHMVPRVTVEMYPTEAMEAGLKRTFLMADWREESDGHDNG